jgi:hypothetical protein
MAGHNRLRRLTHQELMAELQAAYEDAAGWISQAEESGRGMAVLPALGPLCDAMEAAREAKRRWSAALVRLKRVRGLLKRSARLQTNASRSMRNALAKLETKAAAIMAQP